MDVEAENPDSVWANMEDEELRQYARDLADSEEAEAFNCIESPGSALRLTPEQEMVLHKAASSLSDLAKETNSSLSELITASGYEWNS